MGVEPPGKLAFTGLGIEPIVSRFQEVSLKNTVLFAGHDHPDPIGPEMPVPIPGKPNTVSHHQLFESLDDLPVEAPAIGGSSAPPRG